MKKFTLSLTLSLSLVTAFFSYEVIRGMNKICYYTSPYGEVAITISAVGICPLTVEV